LVKPVADGIQSPAQRRTTMPKGYWIGRVDVHDPETYKLYIAAGSPVYAKYGGKLIVRGGAFEAVEGTSRGRNVVIEFKDVAAARACYDSPEYVEARKIRHASATSDLIIIEGNDAA
jgi:uncharacterized protein (DUF1330 family)